MVRSGSFFKSTVYGHLMVTYYICGTYSADADELRA